MNPPEQSILVLGANGRLGAAAVRAFAGAGWRVLAQARRAPAAPLPGGVEHLGMALDATAELAERAAGANAVLYVVNPPYTRWREQALPLLRLGIAVARKLDARLMLPGNVYNFGEGMPATLDEFTPELADTVKGRIRCEMEAELAMLAAQGLHSVVVRAGDFFGCGRGSWMDLVIAKSLLKGRLVYPGPLHVPHAWAYLPDLARAMVAVAGSEPGAPFERLHFAGHCLTGAQLLAGIEAAAGALGIRPACGFRRAGMPWGLIRLGGLLVPMWRELAEMAYLWTVPHALDDSALLRRVGSLPATPLDVALRETLLDLGYGSEAA